MNSSLTAFAAAPGRADLAASFGVIKRQYHAAISRISLPSASNDASFDRSTTEAWALRSAAANGFGEIAVDWEEVTTPTARALEPARGARRSVSLREVLATMAQSIAEVAQRVYARWQQYRLERATLRTLNELDPRTLRDLGFDRSELRSIAVELTGEPHPTRAYALASLRTLAL